MPGTHEEIMEAARMVAQQIIAPDNMVDIRWADGDRITERETQTVFAMAMYELRLMRDKAQAPAQRKARRLLRSLLTTDQLRQFRDNHEFIVTGSSGGHYRLHARSGRAWAVEKHGTRWFQVAAFCIYTEGHEVPPADNTIAHLLMLTTDEPGFLSIANRFERRLMCWDGPYLRRMRQHRLERAAASRAEENQTT